MLPIIPNRFRLVVRIVKTDKGFKRDSTAWKQLDILRQLFRECEKIVVATDAGREGELIFRYIYEYLKCQKPFERLWISSLTDRAIREGFDNLKPGSQFDPLYHSAKARREADWLVGINASQALTFAAQRGNYSLGRVQTPTLAMICRRYLENRDFTPEPYHRIRLSASKNGIPITAVHSEEFRDRVQAERVRNEALRANCVTVEEISENTTAMQPPLLYDLTSLQRDANTRLGLTAAKTLEIAQSLYEKQLISYPRTGCRYIGEDLFEQIPRIFENLREHPYLKYYLRNLPDRSLYRFSVDETKLTDHHALVLTENIPETLSSEEQHIYDMIAIRMLEAFSEECIEKITSVTLACGTVRFKTEARTTLCEG